MRTRAASSARPIGPAKLKVMLRPFFRPIIKVSPQITQDPATAKRQGLPTSYDPYEEHRKAHLAATEPAIAPTPITRQVAAIREVLRRLHEWLCFVTDG